MIKPHKFLNVQFSLLNVASFIVTCLKLSQHQKYDELLYSVNQYFEEDIKDLFIPALSFLYVVDVIDYNKEDDQVELLL